MSPETAQIGSAILQENVDKIFTSCVNSEGFVKIIGKLCGPVDENERKEFEGNVASMISRGYVDLIIRRYEASRIGNHEKYENGFGDPIGNFAEVEFKTDVKEENIPATAFNDLYKWTMMPVMRELEKKENARKKDNKNNEESSIIVTFGVDLRDQTMKNQIINDQELRKEIVRQLKIMGKRKFSMDDFNCCVALAGKDPL
jgi:hypothetical protein